jgi:DNA-binding MarR family transcriptional regulator
MAVPQALNQLQTKMETGAELCAPELRDAAMQAARSVVFSLGSGNADQLGSIAGVLTRLTESYLSKVPQQTESPQEWIRSLWVIGLIATGAYESFGPSAEARKLLENSELARTIVFALLDKDQLQAAELRKQTGIRYQPIVTRLMHAMSTARLVTVEQGPGNTAWYRLTQEGRRVAKTMAPQSASPKAVGQQPQLVAAGAGSGRQW